MKLTPQQYERIKYLLPRQRGNVKMSNLDFLNAILYVAESGCKWRRLPKRFGNWHTVYTRMNRWAKKGVLDQVLAELQRQGVVRVKVDEFASRAYVVRDGTPQEHTGDSSGKDGSSACPELRGNFRERRSGLSEKEIKDGIRPRIEELREAALEEESEGLGQLPLSDDSYRGLINFLKRVSDSGADPVPCLVLTYEGNIIAEWRSSPDKMLSVEFVDPTFLKFVFFHPCSGLPDKVSRVSGSDSVSGFLDGNPNALKFLRSVGVAG